MTRKLLSTKTFGMVISAALVAAAGAQPPGEHSPSPLHHNAEPRWMIDQGAVGAENRKPSRTFSGQILTPMDEAADGLKGSPELPAARQPQEGERSSAVVLRSIHKATFESLDLKAATAGSRQAMALQRMGAPESSSVFDPRAYFASPRDGSTVAPTQTFSWTQVGGAQEYWLWIGSCHDCTDILNENQGLRLYRTVDLPADGRIVYVTLFTLFAGNWYWVDYEFTASNRVVPAALTAPANGATLGNPQTFYWSSGYRTVQYWLRIGNCSGCGDLLDENEGLNTSRTVNLPTDGRVIYVRLYSLGNDQNWYFNSYQFRAYVPVTCAARFYITNDFVYSINIFLNGGLVGSVSASNTQYVDSKFCSVTVSFELVRPTLSGRALGDVVSGYWDRINGPSGRYNLEAGYKIGSSYYFLPQISNHTPVPLDIEVNGGLAAENRCNCSAPAQSDNVRAGYYQLFNNSNVRLFREGTNYSGRYWFWGTDSTGQVSPSGVLYKLVQAPSGIVPLLTTVAP